MAIGGFAFTMTASRGESDVGCGAAPLASASRDGAGRLPPGSVVGGHMQRGWDVGSVGFAKGRSR